ncbi:hypothetical protein NHX12_020736 [Muraenolepis orangiensis]|uniref:Uncharacterized protein n=1 Tax=Muraenolepis orangiensis TaxID=630683 RepID=A0A9Q0IWX1_9TELE|nr:hypothetical protein NHX12_020736 [Muraenolepis orangiensis]
MNASTAMVQVKFRSNDRAAQVIGRQLAQIGDQLHRNRSVGPPYRWPSPLRMLRPALTSAIYRDIQKQLWGMQGGLYGAMKAWIATNQGVFRVEALATWGTGVGWTNGILLTVALVATASLCTALWVEWKG